MTKFRASMAVLFSLLVAVPAFADWDGTTEAEEQAQREAQKKADAGMIESKRQMLGADAKGTTDVEVSAMYDAKVKQDQKYAADGVAKARTGLSTPEGVAAPKQVTGKSLAEIENISDAELEALGRGMERKYGGGQ